MGADTYGDATAFSAAFERAMLWCAGLLVLGAGLAWTTVREPERAVCHPECEYHCGVSSPPLDPGDA